MTVKELIRELKKHDSDRLVVMSIDPEGNGFCELRDLQTAAYLDCGYRRGEVGLEPADLTDKMRAHGYTEDDVLSQGKPALVLWP